MSRLTLTEAAIRIGVSTRTLRRRIKEGSVYAALDNGKYYLDGTEVDRLGQLAGQMDKGGVATSRGVSRHTPAPTEAITLDKAAYDVMVARMGFLEGQRQLLLEDKSDREAKEKELTEARAKLAELEGVVEQLRNRRGRWKGFWAKYWNPGR